MAVCLVCALCWAFAAKAQQAAQFTGEMGGEMVRLSATLKTYQNVPYVSLSQLTEQLGGKARLDGARVEVALGGAKALAGINDTAVAAGRVQFALAHPVVTEYENAYISLDDAPKFFEQSFQVSLTRSDRVPDNKAVTPSAPKETATETEDPKALLKTLELPPPPTAPTAPAEPSPSAPAITPAAPATTETAPAATQPTMPKGSIKHVTVDAGHGGADTGTISPNGTAEKAITVALAARLEKALAESGAVSSGTTRKEDKEISISDRVSAAGTQAAGLLVSVHTGASLSPQAPLVQIYHAPIPAEGGDLAAFAARAKALAEATAKALATGDNPPSVAVRAAPLRLQTAAKMPCLLVELGSLNQAEGEALLVSEEQRGALVDRLAKALTAALAAVNTQR